MSDYAHRLQRLYLLLLLGFAAVALTSFYWGVWQSAALLAREDNPRTVEAELRLWRGRILDTNGVVLAQSGGDPNRLTRQYPLPDVGAAVGYYSLRYGTAGAEQAHDDTLRGLTRNGWADAWRILLNQPQIGRDVRLTLDARFQEAAASLLGDRAGAVLLLALPDGAIRALVSHPTFDPSQLDEQFEALAEAPSAPLLNRVTQGQYQPGLVLQPFVLAAALDQGLIQLGAPVENGTAEVVLDGQTFTCATAPLNTPPTWADVLNHSCPAPMLGLAAELSPTAVQTLLTQFGLTVPTTTTAALPLPPAEPTTAVITDSVRALLGQGQLTVTPLQVAMAWASLAQDGQLVQPQLVAAVQDEQGNWQSLAVPTAVPAPAAIRPATAQAIRAALQPWERIAEYATLALAGPDQASNSWYLGLAPANAPRYVVVVVVEDATSATVAQAIGRDLLRLTLNQ